MSELPPAGPAIVLSPRFYHFAASSLNYIYGQESAARLRSNSKNAQSRISMADRQPELYGLLRAARWPEKFHTVGVNFATALDISVGAYRQFYDLEQKNTFAALANTQASRRKQALEAECGLLLARSYKEFGRIMEYALVEGYETLEQAETVLFINNGTLLGKNMNPIAGNDYTL